MEIAGYELEVVGDLADSDMVLLEDAVLLLLDKVDGAAVHEIHCREAGYDLLISFQDRRGVVELRQDATGEWRIVLPQALDTVVQNLPI